MTKRVIFLWYRKVYRIPLRKSLKSYRGAIFLILFCLSFGLTFGQEDEPDIYDDKGRRDPFLPLVDENGRYLLDSELPYSSAELRLSGILWDPQGKSSALINNEIVRVGDTVGGVIIRDITKDSITVFREGKVYMIRLSIERGEQEKEWKNENETD